jgi:hydrogenase-4 component B
MHLRRTGVVAQSCVAAIAAGVAVFGFAHGPTTFASASAAIPALVLTLGVTPLAAPFCAIVALLTAAAALWSVKRGRAVDGLVIAAFSATMLLVLCARSVTLFFAAWEAMALTSVFLVLAHHGWRDARRAAVLYLVVSQTGAACILIALGLLAAFAGSASFDAIARSAGALPPGTRTAVFVLALLGFGSKAGLVPLHFWLPRAHPLAPAHASALLSGAMVKIALFGLATVALELAAPAPAAWGITLLALGSLSAVAGILYALIERDLKRLLAYSTVENVGVIVVGLGAALLARALGLPGVAALALAAALFHAVNHAVFKGLLFLGAGAVGDSEGTVDLEKLGGLWDRLAWTAPAFLIGAAAIAALPPLNGFASEWLLLRSLIGELHAGPAALRFAPLVAIAALALSGGLGVACFGRAFGIAFLGRQRRPPAIVPPRERFDTSTAALVLLAALCVTIGVAPAFVFGPLAQVAAGLAGAPVLALPGLSILPLTLAVAPLAAALAAFALAKARGVRSVETWTCGSPVTVAAQYTGTAFSKPLRRIFGFLLRPDHKRTIEAGGSRWFPLRIVYRTSSRYIADEIARAGTALALRGIRRSRLVQSGSLRLYLSYAIAAVIAVVVAAR